MKSEPLPRRNRSSRAFSTNTRVPAETHTNARHFRLLDARVVTDLHIGSLGMVASVVFDENGRVKASAPKWGIRLAGSNRNSPARSTKNPSNREGPPCSGGLGLRPALGLVRLLAEMPKNGGSEDGDTIGRTSPYHARKQAFPRTRSGPPCARGCHEHGEVTGSRGGSVLSENGARED